MTQNEFTELPNEKMNNSANPICFQTNSMFYLPGDIVEGIIYISSEQQLHFKDISISISMLHGWTQISRKELHDFEDKNLYSIKVEIDSSIEKDNDQNWIIPPGQHKFPFSFQIPVKIQPTFELSIKNTYVFRRYTFEAKINAQENIKTKIAKRVIQIGAPYKELHPVDLKKEAHKTFKGLIFRAKGNCRIMISAKELCVKYGEKINVTIKVNAEKCSLPVNAIVFEVKRKIRLQSNNKKDPIEIVMDLSKRKIATNIKTSSEIEETFEMKDDDISVFDFSKGFIEQYKFLPTFEQLIISTSSNLFECEYSITAKALCGNDGPSVKLKVLVANQNRDEMEERDKSKLEIKGSGLCSNQMMTSVEQFDEKQRLQSQNSGNDSMLTSSNMANNSLKKSDKKDSENDVNDNDEKEKIQFDYLQKVIEEVKLNEEELDELEEFDENCFS